MTITRGIGIVWFVGAVFLLSEWHHDADLLPVLFLEALWAGAGYCVWWALKGRWQ